MILAARLLYLSFFLLATRRCHVVLAVPGDGQLHQVHLFVVLLILYFVKIQRTQRGANRWIQNFFLMPLGVTASFLRHLVCHTRVFLSWTH